VITYPRNGVITMPTKKQRSVLPFELQQQIEVTNKQVQSTKKKLLQIREERWLSKIENNLYEMNIRFENHNRSARNQSRFFIR